MKKNVLALLCFVTLLITLADIGICCRNVYDVTPLNLSTETYKFDEHIDISFNYYTPVYGDWDLKIESNISDAHDFINGHGIYEHPVQDADITAVWTGAETLFYILYKSGTEGQIFGDWEWKIASDIGDAHDFINGLGAYNYPVKHARITAVSTGIETLFYIFYKPGIEGQIFGDWDWKLASDIDDAHNFINGLAPYSRPVQDADITAVSTGTETLYYIFYKPGTEEQVLGDWDWKLTSDISDAHDFINGHGAYSNPVKYSKITAVSTENKIFYYIFYKSGTPDEMLVSIQPYTNGSLTPNYMASSSPTYPAGSGIGNGWFTITSEDVTVDQLRFQVRNASKNLLLHEFFVPVEYNFSGGVAKDLTSLNSDRLTTFQNTPNPFNPLTTIRYELPQPGKVTIKIINMQGREVRTLVNQEMPAGDFEVLWDSKNNYGASVTSGMYLYTLETQNTLLTKKMILLR